MQNIVFTYSLYTLNDNNVKVEGKIDLRKK